MKKGLILILVFAYFAINQLQASECDKYNSVDLNAGDVVSADLLNDIFVKIEGVAIGLTSDELNGEWLCESFNSNSANLENGYTANSLKVFSEHKKTINEKFEDIEILRFVDLGNKIKMLETKATTIAVDVPDDIIKVEIYLNS